VHRCWRMKWLGSSSAAWWNKHGALRLLSSEHFTVDGAP
jgi:hypothetical protein